MIAFNGVSSVPIALEFISVASLTAEELPFEKTTSRSNHNARLPIVLECETQYYIPDMQTAAAADALSKSLLSPSAIPLDARASRYSRLHITVFADAVAHLAASSPTARASNLPISSRQLAVMVWDCVAATENPMPLPTLPEFLNDLLLPYGSTDSHVETDPENAPSFLPCKL